MGGRVKEIGKNHSGKGKGEQVRQFDTGPGLASECEWSKMLVFWVRHIKWTLC